MGALYICCGPAMLVCGYLKACMFKQWRICLDMKNIDSNDHKNKNINLDMVVYA
jgi:hypothetical protein